MSEDIRKMIDKVKNFKQFVNEGKNLFKGYHCTDSEINGEYVGKFNDYYYIHFPEILGNLKDLKSKQLENKIEELLNTRKKLRNNIELINEIVEHLNNIGLEFIFVNDNPLKEYGENCYKVYFKSDDYFVIEDWNGGDSSSMYCYFKSNKPILDI